MASNPLKPTLDEPLEASDKQLATLALDARGSILVTAWSELDLSAKDPKVVKLFPNAIEASCVTCTGDVCSRKTFKVPLDQGMAIYNSSSLPLVSLFLPRAVPNGKLGLRLLKQPLAIAAIAGMLLLAACVLIEAPLTDKLLTLVGGRDGYAWPLLRIACAMHCIEAIVALYISATLPRGEVAYSMQWALLVLLAGYPVLRFVLRLTTPRSAHQSLRAKNE